LEVHHPDDFHVLQRYLEGVTGVLSHRRKILLSSHSQVFSNFINSGHLHVLSSMLSSQEAVISFIIKGTTFARKFHTEVIYKSFVISGSLFLIEVFKSLDGSSLSLIFIFKHFHFFNIDHQSSSYCRKPILLHITLRFTSRVHLIAHFDAC